MANEFVEALISGADILGMELDNLQIEKLFGIYKLMLEENEKQNLTRITEPKDAAEKHMLDSLTVMPYLLKNDRVADIGCGAGYPTLPLAVCLPKTSFLAVDSTSKRIKYVNFVCEQLNLANVSAKAARAEELGKNSVYREKFDKVTARAVASLNVLSEYCLPLVKVGGRFIAMKANAKEEIDEAKNAIKTLGGEISDTVEIKLPFSQSERTVIVIDKIKNTPTAYPRVGGVISKKPL